MIMKPNKRRPFTTTVYLEEVKFEVDYFFTPAEAEVPYQSNGDPGNPGFDAEIEIVSVHLNGEDCIDFLEKYIPTYEIIFSEKVMEDRFN